MNLLIKIDIINVFKLGFKGTVNYCNKLLYFDAVAPNLEAKGWNSQRENLRVIGCLTG